MNDGHCPPLLGTVYRYGDFICNGKTSSESKIFDDNVLCTRDRGPSRVGVGVSEAEAEMVQAKMVQAEIVQVEMVQAEMVQAEMVEMVP
jgi:hypothetical protein